jgi:hypothetical protein
MYDVLTPYHLIKALLEEWVCGARELYGLCQYLEDLGLTLDIGDDDIDEETSPSMMEDLSQTVALSIALDPSNVDAFFASVSESLTVQEN